MNAVVTVDEAGSRARAMAADAALDGGGVWGQLHGVPITLEDCHPTSGVRSTWGGLPRLADHVPDEDGAVAARLKAAGAVLLGKTHGPEVWPDSVFPRTNNPWNEARTPEARAPALLVHDYEDELYLASPPLLVQRAIFGPLAFIGRLLGYRAEYPYSSAERRESALTVR